MNKDTLHEVVLQIQQMEIDIQGYAGKAFLDNDVKQMEYFRGFYSGLEMLRKDLDEKYIGLLVEEEQAAELFKNKQDGKITFAKQV